MLKKIFFLLLVLFMFIPGFLFGEEPAPQNAVSVEPIYLIFNTYAGSYERAITDLFSTKVSVAYSPNFFWVSDIVYFDFLAEGRIYYGSFLKDFADDLPISDNLIGKLFGNALSGLYAGVFAGGVTASVDNWTESGTTFDASFFALGGGINLGAKYKILGDKFALFAEPFLGVKFYGPVGGADGWTYTDMDGNDIEKPSDFDDGFNRNGLSYGINVGIAF